MKVHNYTYLDEAEIVDVNGSKFAVGEDDTGYLTILSGEIVPENEGDINEEYFFTYDPELSKDTHRSPLISS